MYEVQRIYKEEYSIKIEPNMLLDIGFSYGKKELEKERCEKYNIDLKQLFVIHHVYNEMKEKSLLPTGINATSDETRYIVGPHLYRNFYYDIKENILCSTLLKNFPKEALIEMISNQKQKSSEYFSRLMKIAEQNGTEIII